MNEYGKNNMCYMKSKCSIKAGLNFNQIRFTGVEKEYADTLERSENQINETKDMLVRLSLIKKGLETTYFNENWGYQSYKDENGNYRSKFVG